MDLARTGFIPPDSGISSLVDYTGTITSNGTVISSQGTAKAHDLKLVKTGSPARQPVTVNYASDYDVKKQAGTLTRGELQTGGAVTRITGNYETRSDTAIHMKLTGQNLPISDLANLLPALGVSLPAGSALQGGTATANLAIDGALDKLVTTGTVDLANVKLTNFNLGSKMSAVAALAGIHTSSDTTIQTMNSRLRVAPEGIRADSLTLVVPELGTVTGSGTMSNMNALNFRMAAKLNSNANLVGGLQKIAGLGQVNKPIPFRIEGTAQNPVFIPDVGGMIGNTVTAPAQGVQGIGGILGGFLGKKKKQ
jgi:AsmA protein